MCIFSGDQLYVTGGVNNFRLCGVEVYSPSTDQWMKLRDMHKPRSYHACLAAQGRIYVIGGNKRHIRENRREYISEFGQNRKLNIKL